jgi:UDPglucose--hexose-1-phosphate uridylyltransferase
MLERELAGRRTRVVFEQDALVAFCREAGRFPYELVVAPTTHEQDGFESPLLGRALALLADCVRRIAAVEGPFPWNAWLRPRGHWRIELLPRLSIPAGIELGAGIYVNSLPPEEAAGRLRG